MSFTPFVTEKIGLQAQTSQFPEVIKAPQSAGSVSLLLA